jgi:photosystem II stability/assembly factor-like uncharacterized protein
MAKSVELLVVFLTLCVCAGSVLWTLWPLWKQRDAANFERETEIDGLALRQRETYAALRDLEFEHELGNLTSDDYFVLRERYARRAIALLKAADLRDHEAAAAVEEAVRTLRDARTLSVKAQPKTCQRCGVNPASMDALCDECAHVSATPGSQKRLQSIGRSRKWLVVTGIGMVAFAGLTAIATSLLNRSATAVQPIAVLPTHQVVSIAFSPTVAGEVLLTTTNQVMRSIDGGKSWTGLGSDGSFGPLLTYGVPGSGASRLWLAEQDTIYTSAGDDQTFSALGKPRPGALVKALAVDPSNPRSLYVVVVGGALMHSDDGGTSWLQVNTTGQAGLPQDTASLSLLSGVSTVLFGASPTAGVFASSDDGRSWSASNGFVNGLLPTRAINVLLYDPGSGDRFVAPDGAVFHGALYAGTALGLFKSIDAGGSWRPMALHSPIEALALDPAHSSTILAVDNQGRVYESHDHAETWGN